MLATHFLIVLDRYLGKKQNGKNTLVPYKVYSLNAYKCHVVRLAQACPNSHCVIVSSYHRFCSCTSQLVP